MSINNKFLIILLIIPLFILHGCNTHKYSGFQKVLVKGGDFWLTTYQKINNIYDPYVFYIEGDGIAFINKYKVSSNPTPRKSILLDLALMDTRSNIVYIARPCQYTDPKLNPKCLNSEYWTNKRLSDDVVESIDNVINKINNDQKFSLIGFSGGGAIAILVAARNNMTKNIITIAGNLDHIAFTKYHDVSPMNDSLNPIDYALQINHIPQIHISGDKDIIVPSFIAKKFVDKSSKPIIQHIIFDGVSHNYGWNKIWTRLLRSC